MAEPDPKRKYTIEEEAGCLPASGGCLVYIISGLAIVVGYAGSYFNDDPDKKDTFALVAGYGILVVIVSSFLFSVIDKPEGEEVGLWTYLWYRLVSAILSSIGFIALAAIAILALYWFSGISVPRSGIAIILLLIIISQLSQQKS